MEKQRIFNMTPGGFYVCQVPSEMFLSFFFLNRKEKRMKYLSMTELRLWDKGCPRLTPLVTQGIPCTEPYGRVLVPGCSPQRQ